MSLYKLRSDGLLEQNLKQRTELALARRRVKRLPKPPIPLSTKALERRYFKDLKQITAKLSELTNDILIPALQGVLDRAMVNRPIYDATRLDDYDDEIQKIMELLRIQFLKEYPEEKLLSIAIKASQAVESFNADQINRAMRKVFGAEYSRFEPWLTQELKGFTAENVRLIKSIPEQYLNSIEGTFLRGVQSGRLVRDIKKELKKDFSLTEKRASLIARDQVQKFNGNLTQIRQRAVGVKKYRWQTSDDERVREDHKKRDGKVFEWDNPPEDGHPGQPIACRCQAIGIYFDEDE